MTKRHSRNSQSGFSLVELMVVITIIGILAALATPILSSYRENAKIAAAKGQGVQILNSFTAAAAISPNNTFPEIATCDDVAQVVNQNGSFFSAEMYSGLCPSGTTQEVICLCNAESLWLYYDCSQPPPPLCSELNFSIFDNIAIVFPLLEVQTELYLEVSSVAGVRVLNAEPVLGEPIFDPQIISP